MEEISRALKKGKSSIYYYFGSKEEISSKPWFCLKPTSCASQLTTAIKEVDSPPDKLRNYIFVRMRAFEKLSNYYNAVFDKNLDHYEFIEKIRAEI
ncbi:MAG: TetR/AcrR family transcriptional regulator [Marinilabiliales bacterium]|nr:TetR/AcrR family transcriptional regulator [Marinilabiliales bacterium]